PSCVRSAAGRGWKGSTTTSYTCHSWRSAAPMRSASATLRWPPPVSDVSSRTRLLGPDVIALSCVTAVSANTAVYHSRYREGQHGPDNRPQRRRRTRRRHRPTGGGGATSDGGRRAGDEGPDRLLRPA